MALDDDDFKAPDSPRAPYGAPPPSPARDHIALIDLSALPMLTLAILGFSGFILLLNGSILFALLPILLQYHTGTNEILLVIVLAVVLMFPVGFVQILSLYRLYKLQPSALGMAKTSCILAAIFYIVWMVSFEIIAGPILGTPSISALDVALIGGNILGFFFASTNEVQSTFESPEPESYY